MGYIISKYTSVKKYSLHVDQKETWGEQKCAPKILIWQWNEEAKLLGKMQARSATQCIKVKEPNSMRGTRKFNCMSK